MGCGDHGKSSGADQQGATGGAPPCAGLLIDRANCGSCGNACGPAEVCSGGQCVPGCQPDEMLCNADGGTAYCADIQRDPAHCGCCTNACGTGVGCREGRCDDTTSYGFFVFGDMHAGPVAFNTTVQTAMNQVRQIDGHSMAAFSNGDVVDFPSDASWTEHDALTKAADFNPDTTCPASFGAQTRYFATPGDHDVTLAVWYTPWNQHLPAQGNLGQPSAGGIYYSLTYANTLFVVLDSEHVSSDQTSWLESVLQSAEANEAQLKFVFFHEPVYSCNSGHEGAGAELPWVDLFEQFHVSVVFASHTHVYTRTCPKTGGVCTNDGTGVVFVETGAIGGQPRPVDVTTTRTVDGIDAAGNPRSDAYGCVVGQDLMASNGSTSFNDFCHVRVDGCLATVECYEVSEGNATPFDTWTVNGCL